MSHEHKPVGASSKTRAEEVSVTGRQDSAVMVPNTRDDAPEPLTPVHTDSRLCSVGLSPALTPVHARNQGVKVSTETSPGLILRAPRAALVSSDPGHIGTIVTRHAVSIPSRKMCRHRRVADPQSQNRVLDSTHDLDTQTHHYRCPND